MDGPPKQGAQGVGLLDATPDVNITRHNKHAVACILILPVQNLYLAPGPLHLLTTMHVYSTECCHTDDYRRINNFYLFDFTYTSHWLTKERAGKMVVVAEVLDID